jgi:hypothetical protein
MKGYHRESVNDRGISERFQRELGSAIRTLADVLATKAGEGLFKSPPDLKGIVARPTVAHLIDNCLLLGFYPEKDPQVVTGREENMLRFVGLRVETAE